MASLRFFKSTICKHRINFIRNKYIVLLPEVPEDTIENNVLLRNFELPPFSQITINNCINALGKLLIEHECGIHHLSEKLYDPTLPKNVQNVILPLDKMSSPFDFTWGTFKLLSQVRRHDNIAEAYAKMHPRIVKAKRERYVSQSIYRAFKELKIDEKSYTEPVQRIINKHLLESQLSGIDIFGKQLKQFHEAACKIEECKMHYRMKLAESTALFSHRLEMEHIKEFPTELLHLLTGDSSDPMRGPWTLTLEPHVYNVFMQYCGDRKARWNAWNAKYLRASIFTGKLLNNSIEIEEIRYGRSVQAKLLGFKNFAELSMQTKMAGNTDNVMAMITTLNIKSKNYFQDQITELQEFAAKNGFEEKLDLYDLAYWQRRYKDEFFGQIDNINEYFPLPSVLRNIFTFCNKLFGISVQEATSNINVWHKDVTYYKIYDENEKQVASFFLDPFSRPKEKVEGAFLEIGRNRSDVCRVEPLSYLIFSFQPPQSGKPCLLSYNDVRCLLQKFGHLLQHSLTSVPFSDAAGITNLEWDVVNVCPLVLSHFLSDYDTVAGLSCHFETGEPLKPEVHQNLVKAEKLIAGYQLMEKLFYSAVDMELYTRNEFWLDITKDIWPEYIPFPLHKGHSHACSFPEIFCGEFSAAYYSTLWSEMIAADVFNAFEEVGLDNKDAVKQVGRRFRDTYLSLGGGCHPSEVFRRFRGRDPSTDSLLQKYYQNHEINNEAKETVVN